MIRSLIEKMANHDNNEERRYLREGGRLNVAWGWTWLSWEFGPGFQYEPYSRERWAAWLSLGPVAVEVFWRTER